MTENTELVNKVLNWASKREILQNGKLTSQTFKLFEEIGEIAEGIKNKDKELIVDALGDSTVVIINLFGILEYQYNRKIDTEKLLGKIYNERKNSEESQESQEEIILNLLDLISKLSKKISREKSDIEDELYDILELLYNLSNKFSISLVECLNVAYEEIKDRKGKLLPNGNFVKEEDFEKYGI